MTEILHYLRKLSDERYLYYGVRLLSGSKALSFVKWSKRLLRQCVVEIRKNFGYFCGVCVKL